MMQNEKVTDFDALEKAKKFRLYKIFAIVLFVLFLISGVLIFQKDITLENLRYLVKYVSFSGDAGAPSEVSIRYNADSDNVYTSYRGDFTVVNHSGVAIYDRRGQITLSDAYSFANPVTAVSDKYLLVYDLGGYHLRIYNSFSLLLEKDFSYPIQSAFVTDSGTFCVATAEKSYHAAVLVFNNDFEEEFHWYSAEKFVSEAILTESGKLLISAIRVSEGDLIGEVIGLDVGKSEPEFTVSIENELPVTLFSTKKGQFCLTDRALYFIRSGKIERSVEFSGNSLDMMDKGDSFIVTAQNELSVGISYSVSIYDRELNPVNTMNFSVQIQDICILDNAIYILARNDLYVIRDGTEVEKIPLEDDFSHIVALGKDTVVLCGDSAGEIRLLK